MPQCVPILLWPSPSGRADKEKYPGALYRLIPNRPYNVFPLASTRDRCPLAPPTCLCYHRTRLCQTTSPSLRSALMPMASVNGIKLYYEITGSGYPLLFSHEFAGDSRSWEPQVRYFSRRYQVVTYNHRGYSPSTVPRAARDYSQDLLVEDLHQLITHLELGPVHLGG